MATREYPALRAEDDVIEALQRPLAWMWRNTEVRPGTAGPVWHTGEAPETYPSGV